MDEAFFNEWGCSIGGLDFGFGMAEGCKRFFIRSEFLYCLSAFLPLIGYQHFFFPKQNMKSSCGAMSRGPKSSPLFGMAEELAKKSAFSLSLLSQLFFRQSRKEKLQKKAALSRKM